MASISSNPSSVVSAGTWTGGANTYTSNDVFATNTGSVQNTEYPLDVGGFNFAAIPAGSTIDSVTVTIEAKTGTNNRAQIKGELYDNTTLLSGVLALTNLTATDANYTFTPTATLAQLKSANLKVRVINKRIVSQASTTSVDWVKIDVVYTPPPVVHAVSGTVAVVVGASGAPGRLQQITGSVVVATTASGDVTVVSPVIHQVSGTVAVATGVSGNVTVIAGSTPTTPAEISGCVLGLDATDVPAGTVTGWPDLSPLNNDVIVVSGTPTASGTYVTATTANVLATANSLPISGSDPFFLLARIRTRSVAGSFMGWGRAQTGELVDLWNYNPGALIYHGYGEGYDTIAGAPALTPNEWHTIEVESNGTDAVVVRVDLASAGKDIPLPLNIWPASLYLGAGKFSPGGDFDVSGLFIYDRLLTDPERAVVRDYLSAPPAVGCGWPSAWPGVDQPWCSEAPPPAGTVHQVSGTVAVSTTASGAVSQRHDVSGSVPVAVGTAGTIQSIQKVAGTVPVTVGTAGTVSALLKVAGIVPVTTGLAGTIRAILSVAGTVPVVVGATGTVSRTQQVSGTVPVITTTTGDATRVPVIHQVSGTVAVSTSATGNVDVVGGAVTHQVSGTVAVTTDASGAATVIAGAVIHQVSGTVAVSTATQGAVRSIQAVSGVVPVVSGASGTLTRRQQVSGTVSVVTDAVGTAGAKYQVSGIVPVVTTTRGSPTIVGVFPTTNVYLGDIPVTVALGDIPVKLG